MEADSPTRSYDNQEEEPRAGGKEDFGKRSSDLDLNQAVTKADDDDGDDYQSTGEHWQQQARNFDADQVPQEQRSPLAEQFSRSPSPKGSPTLAVKRSPSPTNKISVYPEPREQFPPPPRKSPSSGRSVSPPVTRRRSPSPRRRQSPGRRRSLSRSPDGGSGRAAAGTDEGRKPYDRHGPSSRSPVERSGRASSPRARDRSGRSRSRSPARDSSRRERYRRSRTRSPSARDTYRRSHHSPHRRASPPRYRSRRDRSPRRRPWSPPPNRITGVGKPGNNLFIAGFSFVTTERDLEKKFSRYGRVTDVRIVRDKRSGDSRGFGFLSLERDEDADAAIRALDQTEWNGRIVLVEKAKPPTRY